MKPSPAFLWNLTIGRCAGIHLPSGGFDDIDIHTRLSKAEANFALKLSGLRRTTWVGGRLALRALLPDTSHDFLPNEHNAPILPRGWSGSISHKNQLAVAWAAADHGFWQLGVDIESIRAPRTDISQRVLTPREAHELRLYPQAEQSRILMTQFSAKEAVYKAIHPFVRRYVGFQEVEVRFPTDDTLEAQFLLTEGPFESQLFFRPFNDFVVTFARVRRATPMNA